MHELWTWNCSHLLARMCLLSCLGFCSAKPSQLKGYSFIIIMLLESGVLDAPPPFCKACLDSLIQHSFKVSAFPTSLRAAVQNWPWFASFRKAKAWRASCWDAAFLHFGTGLFLSPRSLSFPRGVTHSVPQNKATSNAASAGQRFLPHLSSGTRAPGPGTRPPFSGGGLVWRLASPRFASPLSPARFSHRCFSSSRLSSRMTWRRPKRPPCWTRPSPTRLRLRRPSPPPWTTRSWRRPRRSARGSKLRSARWPRRTDS